MPVMLIFTLQYPCPPHPIALGSSPLQQAAVQSFLGNNDKAITCLTHATGENRLPVIILLGKTQMRAGMYPVSLWSLA